MTRAEIERACVGALATVAPEVDVTRLDRDVPLRDQIDLDSMDFLRFVIELYQQTGVDVPEADYAQLATVARAVDYVASHGTGAAH